MISDNYDKILQENNELKQKIKILEYKEITITQIYTDIINKNVDINDLKKENYELKILISKLEDKNKLQDIEITKLKAENKLQDIKITELKQEITELKQENKELKTKIVNLENKEIINKIIYSIQDLNSIDKLETILNHPFNKYINKLRTSRNYFCHYILDDDSTDLINKKKECILNQLTQLTDVIKDKINRRFGHNFIDEIINYLTKLQIKYTNLSDDDIIDAEEWWE
jgi:chromosome segregation ATPase